MKKIIPLLIVPIVVFSVVSGLLFNQQNLIQTENSELKNELFEVNTLLEEEQNTSLHLETQITQLQNQLEQLEQNIVEVETKRNELEKQISKATNRVEITNLSAHGFGTIAGSTMESFVDVTLQNFGINDVEDLILTIKMTLSNYYTSIHTVTVINTGEQIVIRGRIWYAVPGDNGLILATLELNNKIIDQYTISINEAMHQ